MPLLDNVRNLYQKWEKSCHAVICSRFTSKGHRFFANAFVDYAVGEHGLRCDAEDKGPEASVALRFTAVPHR
jgi:hypothetical protein